jgi:hypothetical protein
MSEVVMATVEATLTFKGSVDLRYYDGMTTAEIIHDIIHCGDYEYEVVKEQVDYEFLED